MFSDLDVLLLEWCQNDDKLAMVDKNRLAEQIPMSLLAPLQAGFHLRTMTEVITLYTAKVGQI